MLGIGYRSEMKNWLFRDRPAFIEVTPENWIGRDVSPLLRLGVPIRLHGVSLNLGGFSEISHDFIKQVKTLMNDTGAICYGDHLCASGDAHQLHDLFPIPFTKDEAKRIAGRINRVQDILGHKITVENVTYYTNIGNMSETDWINEVLHHSNCDLLLDINNLEINYKNHGTEFNINDFDLKRINYVHIAGHEYNEKFEMYQDTHVGCPSNDTLKWAQYLKVMNKPILLEWDNELPIEVKFNKEIEACKRFLST